MSAVRRSFMLGPVLVAGLIGGACNSDDSSPNGGGAVDGSRGGAATGGFTTASGGAGTSAGGSGAHAAIGGAAGTSPAKGGAGGSGAMGGTAAASSGASGTTSRGGSAQTGTGGANQAGAAIGGSAATGGASGGSSGGNGAGTLRIMAIGDSTTQATCWRADLWQTLNSNGHAGHFDFVGSHEGDIGCSPAQYDRDSEAYSSSLLTEAVSGDIGSRDCEPHTAAGNACPKMSDFESAFETFAPHVALVHYGTNDIWNGIAASDIVHGFDVLVDALRARNPHVRVFVAQIIPMLVSDATCGGCTCSACVTAIPALDDAIAAWAPGKSTADSPVAVVDQYTGFDADADTRDGVHPNDSGSAKMAAKWDAALEPLF